MLEKFKKHVDLNLPFLKGKRLLVACSGGVDSVVLAHLTQRSGLDMTLAHFNFGLRATESDGDEDFVRRLAEQLGVEVLVKRFDTEAYAEKNRGSIQMAARDLRYQWFQEVLEKEGFDFLVTAHHADDNVETFLINLSRGTGIEGLLGIPEVNGKTVRPLLVFSQEEVMAYAQAEHILWREDSSNTSNKYLRNRIRHEVVPKLKELHPTFLQNFMRTQSHLLQTHVLMDNYIQTIKAKLFEENGGSITIDIGELQRLQPTAAYLYEIFKAYGFTEWDDVHHLLTAMSGKEVVSKTHRLVKDRQHLILSELESIPKRSYLIFENEEQPDLPLNLNLEDVNSIEKSGQNTIFMDKEKLNFPLVLRNWEKGDYFYPFGMQGRKKLSKFFKDEKMDVVSKEKQWLLCSDNDIVWVVGKRADERFKVEDSTRQIVKITWAT
ncbi:tRNA lysidine(34) synthetase TilS [Allomuricauda taeanensis]|uniref:tRNA lysidine(34) synthetase TilS n=1 Tax=Flagellimonas taeanensis TaxID=1005926 RepID=UPI002E7B2F6E|nr:tRNA lysidine(34) synthetase TilS [Allomuricauda taeanensis]MEE1963577.1 tRNA lysidine(34) synthetase TilS [Allomuricauda taeanensis]